MVFTPRAFRIPVGLLGDQCWNFALEVPRDSYYGYLAHLFTVPGLQSDGLGDFFLPGEPPILLKVSPARVPPTGRMYISRIFTISACDELAAHQEGIFVTISSIGIVGQIGLVALFAVWSWPTVVSVRYSPLFRDVHGGDTAPTWD